LKDAEQETARQTYESIANSALIGAQAITLRKFQGSEVIATLMSQIFPNEADWPLITMDGYIPIAESVARLADSTTQSLMVLLDPNNVTIDEFEEHTKQVYLDQKRPLNAGDSEFGFGVWKPDPNSNSDNIPCEFDDCRLHDTSTEPPAWGGARRVLFPLMMHNQPDTASLMYNVYSQEDRGIHLDSMMDCVERAQKDANVTTSPKCAVVTDMLELKIRPGPAGLLFQPVYPARDPLSLVGLATTSIHWEEVLADVVPDYVSGLTCVVSTNTAVYTYEIRDGNPVLIGERDLHDRTYNSYARTATLNPVEAETGALSSAVYTLTVYPTSEMYNAFRTNSPFTVALGFFLVIAFCILVFVLYDFLMRSEASEKDNTMEMKRKFVRFISHEIRTPLSTVCMGLELLESEFRDTPNKTKFGREKKEYPGGKENIIDFWRSVTVDIRENAETAVEILNDLLNYDKLETGQLKLETSFVDIWHLIEKTVQHFQIQAANRKLNLSLKVEAPTPLVEQSKKEDIETGVILSVPVKRAIVVGDEVKLAQVLRNLISNALKFTPENGRIEVLASYLPDGLPDADTTTLDDGTQNPHARSGAIRISVKDSGAGLTKSQLQQLFKEGVQFDANRLQHGGGSGLGLSIAKGMVEQHYGAIWAESEGQGHGTTFVVDLPLSLVAQELMPGLDESTDDEDDDEADQPTTRLNRESREKRILVAEDSASSLKMLVRLLERAGHTCVAAPNGQVAVEAVEADMIALASNPHHRLFGKYQRKILKSKFANSVTH